jgi:Mycotoxin biosynthesis protein UstYa
MRLYIARHYVVPENLASKYGLDPGHLKYAEANGGGYPVLFEFEHHLHCVDLLRQSLFWNYNYYLAQGRGPFSNPPEIIQRHVNHCVDILRQVIMCQPDTGIFGQFWVNEINGPFVDFHTKHKCKNFEDMRGWVDSHQVSEDFLKIAKVVQRPGDIALDTIP